MFGCPLGMDARMGVIMAGFSKAILPFIVVIPGIVAFYLFQSRISDGDQAWPYMVQQFLPTGLIGLVLAGLASAVMSTLSAITNSSSTIFTLDLYKELIRPTQTIRNCTKWVVSVPLSLSWWHNHCPDYFSFPRGNYLRSYPDCIFPCRSPIAACFLLGIICKKSPPQLLPLLYYLAM